MALDSDTPPPISGADVRSSSAHAAAEPVLQTVQRWGRALTLEPHSSLPFLVAAAVAVSYGAAVVAVRVWYEALGPYNVDTSIYWAIGKGILNGFTPYLDLHETKPPGIFILSALSYLLTGDGRLTHATQVLSILIVALAPLSYLPRLLRRPLLPALPGFLALFALVLTLTAFAAEYAREVQTEMHGLAGIVVYMALLGSRRRFAFLGRAAGILVAVGMKEPFLLLVPAVYWILSPSDGDAWSDLVGPLLLAILVGFLVLLVTGWLPPYVGIYLRSMVSGHVQMHAEPLWSRALSGFDRSWEELRRYSVLLPTTLLFVAGAYLVSPAAGDREPASAALARRFHALFAGALLAGLAVGLGGHFYEHHFVFATPLHVALALALMDRLHLSPGLRRGITPALVALALLSVTLPKWTRPAEFRARLQDIQNHDAQAREAARVIDGVLDRLNVNRYLWLGHPGWAPLPFTRHTPLGPLFFQQVMFFEGRFPWLVAQFQKRLRHADVVVLSKHMTGPAEAEVKATLSRSFVPLPAHLIPTNTFFPYTVFVRRGLPVPATSNP